MKSSFILVITLLVLAGCASTQKPLQTTGFLQGYTDFKPNPNAENSWYSITPSFDHEAFLSYERIAFAPIELWLEPDKPYQIKDIKKQEAVTQYFESAVKQRMKASKEIVRPGTKDSILVKMAITYLGERSPDLSPLEILPFKMVMNGGEVAYLAATGQKVVIGEATIEAEFIDTNTNQKLAAVILASDTDEMHVEDSQDNIEAVKSILDHWADRLYKALAPKNKPQ